jgi:hypothetical protein
MTRCNILDGLAVYTIDQFFENYYRPDIVAARLQNADTTGLASSALANGFATPPEVTIAVKTKSGDFQVPAATQGLTLGTGTSAATKDWLVERGCVTLRVSAKDNGGGIDGVRLFNSGKAVGEDVRGLSVVGVGKATYSRDFTVSLLDGANDFRAVAFSRDRTESNPFELKITYTPPAGSTSRLFVLAAAADGYRNGKYNLNFALADAQGFVASIKPAAQKIFSEVQVTEVYEKDLTHDKLVAALTAIQARARPQDVFIFFYAGHGIAVPEGKQNIFYFVLPGVTVMNDPEKLKAAALSSAELRDLVGSIPANKQMLLVDACNSGAFLSGFALRGAAEENALAQLQRSAGIAIFSASTDVQFANEVKDIGHGVFTWALMQGLDGAAATNDGKITAASLKAYIDDAVPLLSQKYRGSEQFPQALVSGQDFPIGVK